MEKVLDIEDVERLDKIKDIKKIKTMLPIDDDLAAKMKREVKKVHGWETEGSKDTGLAAKVARVMKLFNVSDLDDIIKVIPISSIRKIKSQSRGKSL